MPVPVPVLVLVQVLGPVPTAMPCEAGWEGLGPELPPAPALPVIMGMKVP